MARGLVRPQLGLLSWQWTGSGRAIRTIAIATTFQAKAGSEEIRGVAAWERGFMRYFTLITKYAHYQRVAQGAFSALGGALC